MADGQAKPWTYEDSYGFPDAACPRCGRPLEEGQLVQERPAFSLDFFHVNEADCDGE